MILNARFLCLWLLMSLMLVATANRLYAYNPGKGVFLVADKKLPDPRFREAVILMIQHDGQGSAGLVVSRASRLPLDKVLPDGSKLAGGGATLSYGGPVESKSLLVLVKVRSHAPAPADEIIKGLYLTGVGALEEWPDFDNEVVSYRTFVGYAGWAPGQLDEEIRRGGWHLLPSDVESVLAGAEGGLWERLQETGSR